MANKSGTYLNFLLSPSTGLLSSDASLNYITTTTSINEPTAILKHLGSQAKQFVKKEEKVLYTIEGDNGCCLETLTTLQFRMGGGAFLPGMDSNMLDEREVTFPLTHVVTFKDDKIQQIRQYWDQGTLLKQVEAIGKTGRNWPIREGKAQIDAINTSVKSGIDGGGSAGKAPLGVRSANEVVIKEHHKRDSSVSVTRDPHASLNLFAERDPNEDGRTYNGPKHEPVKSAKPAPRDLGELFTNEENAKDPSRSQSPHKMDGTVLKAGAGRFHQGNRLFDEKDDADTPRSPERKKTYSQKYEHFAFGNGEDAPKTTRPASKNKSQHDPTFSFEDFATPPKHIEKNRPDYERHWGAGVDEDDPESPPKRPIVHHPRKDADSHWEMTDESPAPSKAKSFQRQKGLGLYGDPLQEDDRVAKTQQTNVNNARRGDEFGPHYEMTDNSPAGAQAQQKKGTARSDQDATWDFGTPIQQKKIYKTAGDGMGSRKVAGRNETTANWSFESPPPEKKIYKTAGDGMGSRKGGRAWGIGDESDPEVDADVRPSARSRRTQEARAGAELDF